MRSEDTCLCGHPLLWRVLVQFGKAANLKETGLCDRCYREEGWDHNPHAVMARKVWELVPVGTD